MLQYFNVRFCFLFSDAIYPDHWLLLDILLVFLENLSSVVPAEECSNLLFIAANTHFNIWHFWPISKALLKHWFGASIPQRLNDLAEARKGILELGLNSKCWHLCHYLSFQPKLAGCLVSVMYKCRDSGLCCCAEESVYCLEWCQEELNVLWC